MAVSDGTYQRREIVSALAAEKKTATRSKSTCRAKRWLSRVLTLVSLERVMSRPYVAASTFNNTYAMK